MDWKQEAVDRLRQLDRLRNSVRSMGQEIKNIREEMGALHGVDTARVAVRGSGWNDDALMGALVKLRELEGALCRTKRRIREVESALDAMEAEDRLILEEMYVRKEGGGVDRAAEALGVASSGVYRRRDKALREFTVALYGVGN